MPAMGKRASRLNLRSDSSAKAISGRKLRSGRFLSDNRDLGKANVSTRNTEGVVKKSTSKRKVLTNRVDKNNSRHSDLSKVKLDKVERKTRAKKGNGGVISDMSKKKSIEKSVGRKMSNSMAMRQMSLKESFVRQSIKHLRPRKNKKNYCEDSKLLQQYLPSQHQSSMVSLEKLDTMKDNEKKLVYKIEEMSETLSKNKDDVYDFKYDTNDTREKMVKKKKRRNVNRARVKKVKKVARKIVESVKSKLIDNGGSKSESPEVEAASSKSPEKEDALEFKVDAPKAKDMKIQAVERADEMPVNRVGQNSKKPRIISIENADNITIAELSFRNVDNFRSTDISRDKSTTRHKDRLSCTLLTKSLSPISKIHDTFDSGSPWRPPMLQMFSQAKHFVQSTPYVSKMNVIHKKHFIHMKNISHDNGDSATNINVKGTIQNTPDKMNQRKVSNPCRKFGTEITNVDLYNNSTIQSGNFAEAKTEKLITDAEVTSLPSIQLDMTTQELADLSFDDKENTPTKRVTKKMKKQRGTKDSSCSPTKSYEAKNRAQTENADPQLESSSIKSPPTKCDERRKLCQADSNNVFEMEKENSKMITKYDILDDNDAHSTCTTSSGTVGKMDNRTSEVKNAFGFCETESELDKSSLEKDESATNTQTRSSKPNARLLFEELKRHVLPKRSVRRLVNHERKADDRENVQACTSFVDVVNFSDTFDVLSESERRSNCGSNVPLFMDLEPSHFSKVRRYLLLRIYTRIHIPSFSININLKCYSHPNIRIKENVTYALAFRKITAATRKKNETLKYPRKRKNLQMRRKKIRNDWMNG